MEVFMRNIPVDLSEDGLKIQLEPWMKQLGIVDFLCEKPKRKSIGNATFLHRRDGERFLQAHGQCVNTSYGRTYTKSNLKLMGTDILCTLSRNQPQEFTLKTLEHAAQERWNPQYTIEEDSLPVSFSLLGFSCGFYTFVEDQLGFVPEIGSNEGGTMKFTKRNVVVNLNSNRLIRIPLNTIVELVWFSDGSLTLTLSTVPLFFEVNSMDPSNISSLMTNLTLEGNANAKKPQESTRTRIGALRKNHAELVGQCLVYQFNVSTHALGRKIEELKQCEIAITQYNVTPPRVPFRAADFRDQMRSLKAGLANYTTDRLVPFGLLFQLQALAYNAYLLPSTVLELAKQLQRESTLRRKNGQSPVSVDAMRKLFDTIDYPSPYADPAEFEVSSLLQAIKQNDEEVKQGLFHGGSIFTPNQNVTRICRATVTPSRITLHGPEMEPNNRVLRKFPNHHEYFIRVQFCDENGQDLQFSPRVNNAAVFTRYKEVLKRGIEIAGRIYTFLGFSHSSLRAHAVWFSAPFFDDNGELQTYFSIIKAVGNFSGITSPARCAARIGQAFSETPFSVDTRKTNMAVCDIPDVKSVDGERVFSDGVGAVSQDVMKTIWESLPLSKGSPTCFQIRLGGAKGMLAVDNRLRGSVIQLRPSMIKFASEDLQTLEICDVGSQPIPLVLNRQMIKILEDMGVSEKWFFKLQSIQVSLLRKITANIQNTAKYLKGQNISRALRLHKLFREFGVLGIDYKNDRFLRSIVEALVLRELRLLKHKARIPVQKGVTLFGIMDETGYLQENEVFVTFERTKGQRALPPGPGPLVVTRSPALFDGDIQIAYNLVPPPYHPLSQHRNCIVFSQKGPRDLPSQLSGGGLDGDIFNIIWDPECSPVFKYPPADYPRQPPADIGRPVTKDDMADFFINFMETDRLGVIATRHLIMADQLLEGSSSEDCKKLAELHSRAVDFSKTGIPVKVEDMPKMTSRYRPDFLAPGPQVHIHDKSEIHLDNHIVKTNENEDEGLGPPHKYYRSERILGKLYRAVDERQIWSENARSSSIPSKVPFWDEFMEAMVQKCSRFGQIPWIYHLDEARLIRKAYENAIFSAMNDFSEHPINPISELEVFIGHILNKSGVQTHRQRARSIKLTDEFDRIATWVMSQMRPYGNKPITLTGYETEYDALALCLACVYIAGEKDESAKTRNRKDWSGGLQSFRVVSACALLAELELFEKYQ